MGELVKEYYALGLYTVDNMKLFVMADEFKQLTNTYYSAA